MADDIDIEEHNPFQNPRILNILPHFDIKSEPIDVDDEDYPDPAENYEDYNYFDQEDQPEDLEGTSYADFEASSPTYDRSQTPESDHTNEIYHQNNKIILGTKPCSKGTTPIILGSKSNVSTQKIVTKTTPSLITLGSKPSKPQTEGTSEPIILGRPGSDSVSRPCPKSKKPMILGNQSNNPILKSLLKAIQAPLLVRDDSRPVRVPENAVVSLEDWGERLENSPCYCKECQTLFATCNALDAHNMMAHSFLVAMENPQVPESPEKVKKEKPRYCNQCHTSFQDDDLLIKHLYEHLTKKTPNLFYQCPICFTYYTSANCIIRHLTSNHRITLDTLKRVPFKNFCVICKKVTHESKIGHNKHIRNKHRDVFVKINDKKQDNVEKQNSKGLKIALSTLKKNSVETMPTFVAKKGVFWKCFKCNVTYKDRRCVRWHCRMKHPREITIAPTLTPGHKRIQFLKSFIPKDVIFECVKCKMIFMSVSGLDKHRHCPKSSIKKLHRCKTCKKYMNYRATRLHNKQHEVSSNIKTIPFSEGIYNRVLCKCFECKVYFKERAFMKHRINGCSGSVLSIMCDVCKVKVADIDGHKSDHSNGKLVKSDFYFIDNYYTLGDNTETEQDPPEVPEKINAESPIKTALPPKINLKRKLPEPVSIPAKKPKFPASVYNFYYCGICETFTKKHNDAVSLFHVSKACLLEKQVSRCPHCGLKFRSAEPSAAHFVSHFKYKLHLKDYNFFSIVDKSPITPPIPTLPCCKNCKVHYICSPTQHKCDDPKKKCTICNKTFNDHAYKLHLMHHKYFKGPSVKGNKKDESNMDVVNELIQKYESLKSTWNIIYRCSLCKLASDSYDRAVDHSQRHIASASLTGMVHTCEICSIKFDTLSFKKHTQLHANENITKSSFNILTYEHSDLLTDNWLKLFKSLSETEIKQITSSSIYVTRAVKMNVILNGPPEYTIYKCEFCRIYVDASSVCDHSQKCTGVSNPSPCNVCGISFSTLYGLKMHRKIHQHSKVTANSFRIIAFNAKIDKEFNTKLNRAIPDQDSKAEVGESTANRLNRVIFYQCTKCKSCSFTRHFTREHDCQVTSGNRWTCPKCPFVTSVTSKFRHIEWHNINKNITRKDIKIIPFNSMTYKPRELLTHNTWYQCQNCKVLLKLAVKNHICAKTMQKTCIKCNYKFKLRGYRLHMRDHRLKKKLKLDIIPFGEPNKSVNKIVKKNDVLNNEVVKYDKEFVKSKKGEVNRKRSLQTDEALDGETKLAVNKSARVGNVLYKCVDCNTHYLSYNGLKYHFSNNHCNGYQMKCGKCGLSLPKPSMPKHEMQHSKGCQINCFLVQKNPIYDFFDEVFKKRNQLFKCSVCNIHFLSWRQLTEHFVLGQHDIEKYECDGCGLMFNVVLLSKHKDVHHQTHSLRLEDIEVIIPERSVISIVADSEMDMDGGSVKLNVQSKARSEKADMLEESDHQSDLDADAKDGETKQKRIKLEVFPHKDVVYDTNLHVCYCNVHFVTYHDRVQHWRLNDHDESKTKCQICGYMFLTDHLQKHTMIHHDVMGLRTEDFTVRTEYDTVLKRKDINVIKRRVTKKNSIFECGKCHINFHVVHIATKHFLDCPCKEEMANCELCDLKFSQKSLAVHKLRHHKDGKKTLDNIYIFVVEKYVGGDLDKKTDDKYLSDSMLRKQRAVKRDSYKINCAEDSNMSLEKGNDLKGKSSDDLANKMATTSGNTSKTRFVIYKCVDCDIHFSSFTGIKIHFSNFHSDTNRVECVKCGLGFPKMAFYRHENLHHLKKNSEIYCFLVQKCDYTEFAEHNLTQGNKMFKCHICNVHFLCLQYLADHIEAGKHDLKKKNDCDECGIMFNAKLTLTRHKEMHHQARSMRLEDFDIIIPEFKIIPIINRQMDKGENSENFNIETSQFDNAEIIDTAGKCSKYPNDKLKVSSGVDDTQKSILDVTEKSQLDESDMNESAVSTFNVSDAAKVDAADDSSNDTVTLLDTSDAVEEKDSDESAVSQSGDLDTSVSDAINKNDGEAVKLYKCGECNVFFLTQNTCYKHTLSHVPIDPKEYIECKLCSLQFKIMSLVQHIKKHHQKDFKLSNVLVEEYQPKKKDQKAPKIDIYFYMDKVQSRLVSTTTEDEKDTEKNVQDVSQSNVVEPSGTLLSEMCAAEENNKPSEVLGKDINISISKNEPLPLDSFRDNNTVNIFPKTSATKEDSLIPDSILEKDNNISTNEALDGPKIINVQSENPSVSLDVLEKDSKPNVNLKTECVSNKMCSTKACTSDINDDETVGNIVPCTEDSNDFIEID